MNINKNNAQMYINKFRWKNMHSKIWYLDKFKKKIKIINNKLLIKMNKTNFKIKNFWCHYLTFANKNYNNFYNNNKKNNNS